MMSSLAFDSLRFARRLKEAGVPEPQAEAQAELMAETFGYYVDNLVTKDYLDASFAEQDARIDARFAEQDARFERLISDQKSLVGESIAKQNVEIERLRSSMDAKFNVMAATLALIAASVVPGAINNFLSG